MPGITEEKIKEIVIKQWFSSFSVISGICALAFWVTFILGTFLKLGEEYIVVRKIMALVFPIAGAISGSISVHAAHKVRLLADGAAVAGMFFSITGLFVAVGFVYGG